jgi:hypothetical protein
MIIIKDVWQAIKVVSGIIITVSLLCIVTMFVLSVYADTMNYEKILLYAPIVGNILISIYTINVWKALSTGYIIDKEKNTFEFPASDVENSVYEIITLKPLFDLAKRRSITLTEIKSMNNETKRWTTKSTFDGKTTSKQHVAWLLNISGEFGSQQLEFSSKQKRDECRSAINIAVRGKGTSDLNFDM